MLHEILSEYKVILASKSPRRREIFDMLQIPHEVIVSEVLEPITNEDPALQAMRNARNKALAIAKSADPQAIVVSADTIVVMDDQILGKPADEDEAFRSLRLLSGKSHHVITGICVTINGTYRCAYEKSKVFFAPLSDDEIRDYIATHEPLDKAGAYGIQGFGSQFISGIEGCYFNVMGFPVKRFYELVKELVNRNAS